MRNDIGDCGGQRKWLFVVRVGLFVGVSSTMVMLLKRLTFQMLEYFNTAIFLYVELEVNKYIQVSLDFVAKQMCRIQYNAIVCDGNCDI